jgi:hypothetical protein
MNKISVDNVENVLVKESNSPIKIVIAQRGWVFVGRWHREGNDCKLTNASVIRVWGTTKGLGEITSKPTDETILDKCGTVCFDYLTVVATLDCEVEGWKNVL